MAASGLHILIVDDEPNIRRLLGISLTADGHHVESASNPDDARDAMSRLAFDLAFVDLRIGASSGLDLIPALIELGSRTKIVVITAYAAVDTAVEAMRRGAFDYLSKPFTPDQVRQVVERVAATRVALDANASSSQSPRDELTSGSPLVQRALDLATQVAATEASVLLRGESGTGKTVLARRMHDLSGRAKGPFTTVSTPSLSADLLESELFGHVRGAFTGAHRDKPGRIAATAAGTLFLDEIGDLPVSLQPKLLRFLQEREYERVGDTQTRRADVRVIAATNVDLEAAVGAGQFREDLLYRLNVVQIDLPPLRERAMDIVPLAREMLASIVGPASSKRFTDRAVDALERYAWPGNLRELRNAVERAAILARTDAIDVHQLPEAIASPTGHSSVAIGDRLTLDELEERHIRRVMSTTRSLEEAANVLGIDAATLWRRRKRYGI